MKIQVTDKDIDANPLCPIIPALRRITGCCYKVNTHCAERTIEIEEDGDTLIKTELIDLADAVADCIVAVAAGKPAWHIEFEIYDPYLVGQDIKGIKMSLTIEFLETRQKSMANPQREPTCIFLSASDPDVAPDLRSVFKEECEALLPAIFQQAGLRSNARVKWTTGLIGQRVCLVTDDPSYFDVYVTVAPDLES